jgi:ADP-heptose:LPS heptosyltransferase
MRQAVPFPSQGWPETRLLDTIRHYRRRAWRWARVLTEYRPGTTRPLPGKRRVLVVRLDAIGDFVLWSGAARALRAWLGPDAHVTLAANATWADLARDADIADEVWPVRRSSLEWDGDYRSQMLKRVQGGRFSLAINPRFTREMIFGDSMMRWSRAERRIGWVGESHLLPDRERRYADQWYTELFALPTQPMHETEINAEFLRRLGASVPQVPAPELFVYRRPLEGLDELREGYFVIFPGASSAEKRWAPDQFAAVARYVQQKTGWRPVLLGERNDASVTKQVADAVPGAIDLAGATSVAVLASAIQQAQLVVTNDTSAVHLAAATRVPAVCVVGGWQWRRFVPYPDTLPEIQARVEVVAMEAEMGCFNCNWRCVQPHVPGQTIPCVARVPMERVIAAVDRVLSRKTVTQING